MDIYQTNKELLAAYTAHISPRFEDDILADMNARSAVRYVPHLYRGGDVIPGFGYSVERIGKYVSPELAGNPGLIGPWLAGNTPESGKR